MNGLLLTTLLCACLAFAGCTGGNEPAPPTGGSPLPTTPATSTPAGTPPATPTVADVTPQAYVPYSLDVSGVPAEVEAGQNFTFVLRATGGAPATSDHIGAHFGNRSAAGEPANTTTYARACQHVTTSTPVPGTFQVTCSMPGAGAWYLRGHVLAAGNHSWGSETAITARPAWTPSGNYTLNLTGVPTVARANENVTMNLSIAGPPGLSSHFGAHFNATSRGAPTVAAYNGACSHQTTPTTVPPTAPFVVTCTFPAPGTYYLRGHLRVDEGIPLPTTNNYWTGEHVVLVL